MSHALRGLDERACEQAQEQYGEVSCETLTKVFEKRIQGISDVRVRRMLLSPEELAEKVLNRMNAYTTPEGTVFVD